MKREAAAVRSSSSAVFGCRFVRFWTREGKLLPPTWFSLQTRHLGHVSSKSEDSGSILLTALLYGRSDENIPNRTHTNFCIDDCDEQPTKLAHSPIINMEKLESSVGQTEFEETLSDHEEHRFIHEKEEATTSASNDCNSPGFMCELSHDESITDVNLSSTFEELIGIMQSSDNAEMPENLQGGVLLDQIYMIEPDVLNSLLFEPNSNFRRDLAEVEGTSDYQEGPWTWNNKDIPYLRRSVSCTKAATKLIKSVKAIEEQSYLKADGKNFAVIARTRISDVPYGDCFEVYLMYKIIPIPQLSSCDESTRLVISWNIVFCHNTLMKGMIEETARQGLQESYEIFAKLLAQRIRPVISSGVLDKNQLLAPLELFRRSYLLRATKYYLNFTVIFTIFIWLYVLVHIVLSRSRIHCLEFNGIDLPDTFGEIFTSGILILQGERVFHMIAHFIRARLQREILEFDAMEEPPAILDVEVFDFDGPFDLEFSLGHAEINFLKHTSDELTDLWVPLEGELAQVSQSKLHLKIFLDNTKGVETMKEYLIKMEKEVGKKLNPRSPQKNSTFQRIFSLPPEEFLIKDFSCYLRRKLPLQGRIFISARIVGFYSNFFGHKTKFLFLWEDIEDIQVIPPSFATLGTPGLLMILRSGRGFDARHGAKFQNSEGRLNFQFQSFASFSNASKTIIVLWRTKTASYEDGAKLEDQLDQDGKKNENEDSESLLKQ